MKKTKIIITVLTVFALLFIFVQSALPVSVSSAESDLVTEGFFRPLQRFLTGNGNISVNTVRKIAHVIEYFVLGMLMLWVFGRKKWYIALGICAIAAFIDESIQILSHRGSMIQDVWIDCFGVALGILLAVGISLVFNGKRKK